MLVDDFGYDDAIDYKSDELLPALREKCPDRVNVYFDNVGGEVLDAVLGRLARGARIVICGAVSQYNESTMRGPSNYIVFDTPSSLDRGSGDRQVFMRYVGGK